MNIHSQPDPEQILLPENIADDLLAALAPVLVPRFIAAWTAIRAQRFNEALGAAQAQDGEALKHIRREVKSDETWLARGNERLGHRATPQTLELQSKFGELADDILLTLRGELPEQQEANDPSDDWKHS